MKKFGISLALVGLLGLGGQAFAEIGSIDAVPAATLLLPYFEVDMNAAEGAGTTTVFSVNNASAAPALAHVTIWSNWSQPVLDFDLFLTGYDVQTINLYNIIVNGNLPVTADMQADGGDTISPHQGAYSNNPQWDGTYPSCAGVFPFTNPIIQLGGLTERVQDGLSGQDVGGNGCMGLATAPGIATGYITIDNVTFCSTDFPSEVGYFVADGQGIANNINQLWGDYNIIDPGNASAHGDTLVHVEAQDGFVGGVTGYTFYGRYIPGQTGDDNREPLGTTWAARYLNGGAFTGGTDLVVWRDSTTNNTLEFYGCGVGPDWYPLNETEVIAFNESEDAVEICFATGGGVISPPTPGSDATCFPLETQRVKFGEGVTAVPFDFGWTYLNLNINDVGVTADADFGSNGTLAQSHVTNVHSALGLFSTGYQAIELTDGGDDVDPTINGVTGTMPTYSE
ncbi:MAG: hypothetical protein K8J08_16980 [Thermoanaerobaculia bacterium]|nr:hypothetical protein [Thermoanaerobaculia bacterium]